jgi:hypothetical protein
MDLPDEMQFGPGVFLAKAKNKRRFPMSRSCRLASRRCPMKLSVKSSPGFKPVPYMSDVSCPEPFGAK